MWRWESLIGREIVIAFCSVALVAVPIGARAGQRKQVSAHYYGSTVFLGDSTTVTSEPAAVGIAGYDFPPTGQVPMRVDVSDLTGGVLSLIACQDTDGDGRCSPSEPLVPTCGNSLDLTQSQQPFTAMATTQVMVKSLTTAFPGDLTPTPCLGVGTTGTITVSYRGKAQPPRWWDRPTDRDRLQRRR